MTWTTVNPDPLITGFFGIGISDPDAQHIYVTGYSSDPLGLGVFASHDYGTTWTRHEIDGGNQVPLTLACSADGTRLVCIASAAGGLPITPWYSTDSGVSWTQGTGVSNTSYVGNINGAYLSGDGMTALIISGTEDIWVSYDGGASYVTRTPATATGAGGAGGSNDATVLLTSNAVGTDIEISTDNGVSFNPVTGLPAFDMHQPSVKGDGSRIYLTDYDNAVVYVSTNGGSVWNWIPATDDLYETVTSRSGSWVVVTNNGFAPYDKIYRSSNDLSTYEDLVGVTAGVASTSRVSSNGSVVALDGSGVGLVWLWLETTPPPTPVNPYPLTLANPCPCGEQWQFDSCQLATGVVRAVLRPTAADWQTVLNGVGRGSMTFPARGVTARDIWPDHTSVYITRTPAGGGEATTDAFIITAYDGSNGTVQVGMESIESYLYRRLLDNDLSYPSAQQTQIAASLVNQTTMDGIPLTSSWKPSAQIRTREYVAADNAFIGALLDELVKVQNGVEWRLVHTKTGGAWATKIEFADHVGTDSQQVLRGDVEANAYGMQVTGGADHATLVRGKADTLTSTRSDFTVYPRFDTAQDFTGIVDQTNLDTQTGQFLGRVKEPVATPVFTITGPDPHPSDLRLGDTAEFVIDQGAIKFDGRARVGAITWRISADAPESRELSLIPLDPASQSVLNA